MRRIVFSLVSIAFIGFSAPASAQLGMLQRHFDHLSYQGMPLSVHDFADVGGGSCQRDTPRRTVVECTQMINARQAIDNARNHRQRRSVWYTLRADAHAELGDIEDAERDYRRAIAAYRGGIWIYFSRATTHEMLGNYELVLESLNQGLEVDSDIPQLLGWSAWILATVSDDTLRDGTLALARAQSAVELTDTDLANYIDTLAAAYAETGDFASAVEEQRRAIDLARTEDPASVSGYEYRLELYLREEPFRFTPQSES